MGNCLCYRATGQRLAPRAGFMTDLSQPVGPVLLVEDNADDAELTRILLRKAGIKAPVINAETISAALQVLDQATPGYSAPSMIFLDLGLP